MLDKFVIIVAGGSGKRMNSEIPKQFLEINGKPLLIHTFESFLKYDSNLIFILSLPENNIDLWKNICIHHRFNTPHTIVKGGAERFFSVRNALAEVKSDGLIAIHDGVRPLVSVETISRCFEAAEKLHCVIPVMDIPESIRCIDNNNSHPVDRNNYKLVQTPQVFLSNIILEAYKQNYNPEFTDDASVVEKLGITINLVEGNRENIKITTPFDLQIAKHLL